ncbi:NAD(P)H-dependent oxidoreductase [Streptomyces sp. NBC_01476]|uniref:NADPH-dependent FMN reductase n=1 Tax=Streptomyces sp. NBC_01476 TaxID=2903881 RepID=UPI002E3186A3|nr:NAD(P)H-dependent oxidoreductase [Streptomyces sp. NBC_01476]
MAKLGIIVASTRPGRVGLPVAQWFEGEARAHAGFAEVELIDLAEVALPFMNEPNHPRFGNYTHQHTRDWSALVGAVDAFVFVMPEYNYGYNAELKNAIDYLHNEWKYKPVGFVSYGGVSAGTRAVQMIKQVVTTLKMTPVFEAVSIPFVHQFLDEEEGLVPNEVLTAAAKSMLDELVRVEEALRPLRPALAESPKGA